MFVCLCLGGEEEGLRRQIIQKGLSNNPIFTAKSAIRHLREEAYSIDMRQRMTHPSSPTGLEYSAIDIEWDLFCRKKQTKNTSHGRVEGDWGVASPELGHHLHLRLVHVSFLRRSPRRKEKKRRMGDDLQNVETRSTTGTQLGLGLGLGLGLR